MTLQAYLARCVEGEVRRHLRDRTAVVRVPSARPGEEASARRGSPGCRQPRSPRRDRAPAARAARGRRRSRRTRPGRGHARPHPGRPGVPGPRARASARSCSCVSSATARRPKWLRRSESRSPRSLALLSFGDGQDAAAAGSGGAQPLRSVRWRPQHVRCHVGSCVAAPRRWRRPTPRTAAGFCSACRRPSMPRSPSGRTPRR